MNKIYKYINFLHRALQIIIGIDIIYRCKSISDLLIYFGLYLVVIINDYLRVKYFYKSIKNYYLSIFLTMVISSILTLTIQGYIDIYFYMILYELILYTDGKISLFFVLLQVLIFLFINAYKIGISQSLVTLEFWKEYILDVAMVFMFIIFYSISLYSYKILRKEKHKVDKLNKELELSYKKLKEQSEKIEELTIAKERNRVAREIHDNLGHSLVALNMTLDVAEKTIDRDMEKAKELILKSQKLVKESMDNLRKAVYALKEEKHERFTKSIEEMAENIESTGKVKVILNINDKSESLSPEYKEILYFTIKEALTNSIKHGKADEIRIDLSLEENVKLIIKDNGIGCKNLVKGNGILGLESRIKDYNGKMSFITNDGFMIELSLPY
ncbi:MAG TPA: sensor histidine kinase [Tissierellaceae bacterium]